MEIMYILEKINKQRIIFFLIAIFHFLVVLVNTPSYSICTSIEQKINFFFVKSISFILIVALWQFVSFIVDTIKESKSESGGIVNFHL